MKAAELSLGRRFIRTFHAELEDAGEDVNPVLLATVPTWNGFVTTPDDAARVARAAPVPGRPPAGTDGPQLTDPATGESILLRDSP